MEADIYKKMNKVNKILKENEYQCHLCGNIYEKMVPEKEARNELKEMFGDISVNECKIVCDDCFKKHIIN